MGYVLLLGSSQFLQPSQTDTLFTCLSYIDFYTELAFITATTEKPASKEISLQEMSLRLT